MWKGVKLIKNCNSTRRISCGIAIVLICLMLFFQGLHIHFHEPDAILPSTQLIIHACGSINNISYTNSQEALLQTLNTGARYVEVDLELTSDNHVVLAHDFSSLKPMRSSNTVPSLQEFCSSKIQGRYSPLTFKDLVEVMLKYPDLIVELDSKKTDSISVELEYKQIMSTIYSLHATAILPRLVVVVFSQEMYATITKVYPFQRIIYDLLYWPHEIRGLCTWSIEHKIEAFCIHISRVGDHLTGDIVSEYHIPVHIHTVNDYCTASKLLKSGIAKVYTDSLHLHSMPDHCV